jgi:hypothetical protein
MFLLVKEDPMKQRQWKTTRQLVERPDAQHRFDQAYQCLMYWSQGPLSSPAVKFIQVTQEESDENSRLRPRLDPASGPDANH